LSVRQVSGLMIHRQRGAGDHVARGSAGIGDYPDLLIFTRLKPILLPLHL